MTRHDIQCDHNHNNSIVISVVVVVCYLGLPQLIEGFKGSELSELFHASLKSI